MFDWILNSPLWTLLKTVYTIKSFREVFCKFPKLLKKSHFTEFHNAIPTVSLTANFTNNRQINQSRKTYNVDNKLFERLEWSYSPFSFWHRIHELSQINKRQRAPFSTEIIHLFKVSTGNTRAMCEILSKLAIKTPEWFQWRRSCVFIVNFE